MREGLRDDAAFHDDRGLAGGRPVVLLLHHVVNGIMLDHLTIPLDPGSEPVATARDAARRLTAGLGASGASAAVHPPR